MSIYDLIAHVNIYLVLAKKSPNREEIKEDFVEKELEWKHLSVYDRRDVILLCEFQEIKDPKTPLDKIMDHPENASQRFRAKFCQNIWEAS